MKGFDTAAAIDSPVGFDPYRAWLGVREVRRPLNAYQLLSLPSGEEDVETIHAAASVKRAALLAHREEAVPEIWAQIFEELEAAIELLVDADKKAAYDLSLHAPGAGAPRGQVVAGAVTERDQRSQLRCRGCRAGNPATRKFCSHCGQPLWEPCSQCGTICAAGERFCGACGANLDAGVQQQIERAEAEIERAEQLQRANRFADAIDVLGTLSQAEHPRLTTFAARAGQMLKQLVTERDRKQLVAGEKLKEAETLLANRDYAAAVRLLGTVPQPLWTEPMQAISRDCQLRLDEIETLTGELKEALAARRLEGLLPTIERLLALKPDHAGAQQLAKQIQECLCRAAKELLLKHQYEKARRLLDQAPDAVRTDTLKQYYAHAAELAFLASDLRTAPFVDQTLLEVANRFAALAPRDAEMAALIEKLRQRGEAAGVGPTFKPVLWAAPPEKPAAGLPVEWVTHLPSIGFQEGLATAPFIEQAGGFIAACGLALQGVGQGPLHINLLPPDRRTMFGRVTNMMGLKGHTAWGIDVSNAGIKGVRLAWDDAHKRATIEAGGFLVHRKSLSQTANEAEEDRIVDESLKRFLELHKVKADRLVVGVPGRWLLCRQFKLPPIDNAKLRSLVEYEARLQVPVELDQLVWDFADLAELNVAPLAAKEKAAKRDHEVVVVGVKKLQVGRLLGRFRAAGLHADVVQGDALAIYNALSYEFMRPSPDENVAPPSPLAVLDVGADATNFVCVGPRVLWFRNFGIGGQSATRALIQELNLTQAQAEQLKCEPARAKRLAPVYHALSSRFDDLLEEIRLSREALAKIYPNIKPAKLLVLGGGLRQHGLLRYLQRGA